MSLNPFLELQYRYIIVPQAMMGLEFHVPNKATEAIKLWITSGEC